MMMVNSFRSKENCIVMRSLWDAADVPVADCNDSGSDCSTSLTNLAKDSIVD